MPADAIYAGTGHGGAGGDVMKGGQYNDLQPRGADTYVWTKSTVPMVATMISLPI